MRPFSDIDRLARATVLDTPAETARDLVHRVVTNQRVKDALHGVWLGHPLHPALAQLSLGALASAGILDVTPATRPAAGRLIGVGLAAAVPTIAAGWVDYADGHEEQQRLGIVHAAGNATMVTGFVASAAVRRRRPVTGAVLGWVALAIGGAAAALGGHMTYRQAMGANSAEPEPHLAPEDWQPIADAADVPEGVATARTIDGVSVLLVRRGSVVHALADRCSHAAAPLHEGTIEDRDGTPCVICPWHGSVFGLRDGAVVHGPATAPQPLFDAREHLGRVEVRVRGLPGVPVQ